MSEVALILRGSDTLAFTDEAKQIVSAALEKSALIGKVTNAAENGEGFEAQKAMTEAKRQIEAAAQELIDKANDFKKRVWKQRDELLCDLIPELSRVSGLLGDFAAVEQAKARAAERLRNEELSRLERERAEALAKASSIEAQDAVAEHFDRQAKDIAPAPEPARAEGQVLRNDWEVTVSDIHMLYRFHPNCVRLEPLVGEIKNLLKAGATVKGVVAKAIVKTGVKAGRALAAIDV